MCRFTIPPQEYLDENSFDNTKPPKNRFIDSSKDFDSKVSLVDGSHKAQSDAADDMDDFDFGDAGSNFPTGRSVALAVATTAGKFDMLTNWLTGGCRLQML